VIVATGLIGLLVLLPILTVAGPLLPLILAGMQ
jgi:hypothetical protein